MNKNDFLKKLYEKDDNTTYKWFLELESNSLNSNEMYKYFNDFLNMLDNKNSYVRVRGFRLICTLTKWDVNNIIDNNIDKILATLDDEKPTVVRQCLASINNILLYKIELTEIIKDKLLKINYLKYKDSMSPLIKKDIENIIKNIGV